MATVSCTINGFKYYNGGWIPSSGFSTANSSVSGYGGGSSYAAVYKFTIPSVSGTVSSATITFNLPWIDGGYYNNFNSNWYITTGAPSSGMAVQGTKKASGNVQGAGSGSQQWKTVTFTTGAFSASAGTYYLWLTGGSMPAEFGGHLTATLNYTTGGSSGSTSSTTIRPTASLDRDVKNGTSWANYTQDSDCSAYDSGYTIRIGGSTSAKNFNGWFTFPTGSRFLDPAKYEITAANFKVFQPYFASPNAHSGSGTIRFRAGKMTPSGTNGLSSTSQTATVAAITTDGTWYTFSNTLAAAKALQSGAANGVYMDVSDWSSKHWYSRLTYHGGSSYYPRFTVSYKSKQYALSVPAVTGASVNGAGTFTWGTSVTVTCTPNTGYTFSKWQLSGGSSASSTNSTYKFTMPTAATTATAVVTKNTYTLTVAKPTGVSSVSGGGSKTWGTSVTVSCTPATGYRFVRWQLSGGSTATSTSQNYTFTMPMAATTATPVVTANTYTITYNANGGSGAPSSQSYTYATSGSVNLSSTVPTRTGYTFLGWSQSSTATSASYSAGQAWAKSNASNYTLYAVWAENKLTVYYYSNYATTSFANPENAVGANRNVVVRTYEFYYDNAYPDGLHDWTYTGAGTYLARAGYTGTGNWGTSVDGGTLIGQFDSFSSGQAIAEAFGKSLKTGNASINLYAQWQGDAHTVSYDANGGTVSPSSSTFYYGNTITSMPIPTMSGYSLDYWYVNFDGSNYLNLGRHYMYTDKISVHLEAYMDNWADYHDSSMRLISCTEGGGWNIESSGSYINFACYDAGIGYKSATASITWASLSAGWHSFDLVFDGSKAHGYIDGVEVATSDTYVSGAIGYTNENNSIFVGAEAGGDGSAPAGQYFTGKVRNLVITNSDTINTNVNGKFTAPTHDFTLEASWAENIGVLRIGSSTYTPYVYYNGAWVTATAYAYVNGKWVEGI